MEKKGEESEYMKLYWTASDLGEVEATSKLAEFYRNVEFVEIDNEESERLRRLLMTQFQKSDDGLEWRINQEDKTLFIRGGERMNKYNPSKPHVRTTRGPFSQWSLMKESSQSGDAHFQDVEN